MNLLIATNRTIRVRNKGAYIADIGISYYNKLYQSTQERVKLLSLQSYTFVYPADSISAVVFGSATAGRGVFLIDLVSQAEKKVCLDVYGVLLTPKFTRMDCVKDVPVKIQ
jgi:hypothetical protein